jgi:hypothetical protein
MARDRVVIDADWSPEAWNGDAARAALADPGYVAALAEVEAHEATNCNDSVALSPSTTIPAPPG